ncbi:hypothetical protein A1355_22290 [Methylomonas koyamae]|uniref:Uncharacterized protein n=1 Tax=Methylomonas koyamae TaxID=702114 RepID=A0A177NY88_9GAMM|nr:hypothetical protein A1355_22290 [Methylomonas koyamae]
MHGELNWEQEVSKPFQRRALRELSIQFVRFGWDGFLFADHFPHLSRYSLFILLRSSKDTTSRGGAALFTWRFQHGNRPFVGAETFELD